MKPGIEDKIRKGLAVTRLFQTIVPPSLSNSLLKVAMKRFHFAEGTSRESILANGIPCEWIKPQEISLKGVMIYIHGGGFVVGLTPNHFQMVANLAGKMGIRTLMIDYRLAPKYPFPAALEDCVSVYKWVLAQGVLAKNIIIAGDSAGGNLTITSLMKIRELNIPLPVAAVCLSPVVDLNPNANHKEGYRDPLLPPKAMQFYTASYVGNNDTKNPLISPLYGDFAGLPPMLIHIGEDEVLRDNAEKLSLLAKEAGANVTYKIYPKMWHVWQLYSKLPQASQSLDEIVDFFVSHLLQKGND